jgi:hypothetical protein
VGQIGCLARRLLLLLPEIGPSPVDQQGLLMMEAMTVLLLLLFDGHFKTDVTLHLLDCYEWLLQLVGDAREAEGEALSAALDRLTVQLFNAESVSALVCLGGGLESSSVLSGIGVAKWSCHHHIAAVNDVGLKGGVLMHSLSPPPGLPPSLPLPPCFALQTTLQLVQQQGLLQVLLASATRLAAGITRHMTPHHMGLPPTAESRAAAHMTLMTAFRHRFGNKINAFRWVRGVCVCVCAGGGGL